MPTTSNEKTPELGLDGSYQQSAQMKAVSRLLLPLARLCLAHGITFAAVEELLKQAFVQEADALEPGAAEHGKVSRISTATGLTRREVTRLVKSEVPVRSVKTPVSSEIFARWTTDPKYRNQNGAPSVLKRQGQAPSFETLAQSITRDVHPRSMLDELVRLGLVKYEEASDKVSLKRNEFVPSRDAQQMLDLLGENVGDHLTAAVENVLHDGNRHLEQAVFADELSAESLERLRPLFSAQWTALRDAMVPVIMDLIDSDRLAGREQDRRMRIGIYTFDDCITDAKAPRKGQISRRFRNTYLKDNSK